MENVDTNGDFAEMIQNFYKMHADYCIIFKQILHFYKS